MILVLGINERICYLQCTARSCMIAELADQQV